MEPNILGTYPQLPASWISPTLQSSDERRYVATLCACLASILRVQAATVPDNKHYKLHTQASASNCFPSSLWASMARVGAE